MVKLRTILLTSFQETLHRRVLYLVLVLAVVVIAVTAGQMAFVRMAREAGETEAVRNMAISVFGQVLNTWTLAAMFLALFLGSVAISSEIKSKTIVTVLSRPIPRWAYLLGRWLGVLLFLWGFLLLGIIGALFWGAMFDLHYGSGLWLGIADLFVGATLLSGVSVGLSVVLPPVGAGAVTFFLTILPHLVRGSMEHPRLVLRGLSVIGYYLAPAVIEGDLIRDSLKKELLDPKYYLHAQVMLENLLYAAAVLLIAGLVFKRRELRLR